MYKENKALGWGSLSLVLFIIAVLFSYLTIDKKTVGEHALDFIKVDLPEAVITVIFLILDVVISNRFSTHLFAKTGMIMSLILLGMFVVAVVVCVVLDRLITMVYVTMSLSLFRCRRVKGNYIYIHSDNNRAFPGSFFISS